MPKLAQVLAQLRSQRARLDKEISQIDQAIRALSRVGDGASGRSRGAGRRRRSRLSAAARGRIAAAQRARWAKVRQQKQKQS